MFSTLSTFGRRAPLSPAPAENYGQNANFALFSPMLYFSYQILLISAQAGSRL